MVNRLVETVDYADITPTELIADLTQAFASSLNIDETLRNVIDRFMHYLNAEAASIFLLEENGGQLICRECAGPVDVKGITLPAGSGIVGRTVLENSPQMVRDVSNDASFAATVDENTGFDTRSILCMPLTVGDHCIGALELINKRSGDGLFAESDLQLATAVAATAALAIHNARMAQALVEQQRMQKELELARQIQEALLPIGEADDFPIHGLNIPAREVSGDFFDFIKLNESCIYFNIADVSGKGMNAALLMAKTTSLLHCLAKSVDDPAALISQVNGEICETTSMGMFVTIVCGFVDLDKGVVRFVNAGHQPPLLCDVEGVYHEFPAAEPPLGISPDIIYSTQEIELAGGCLYLFTDGITEAAAEQRGMLEVAGIKALLDTLSAVHRSKRLARFVEALELDGYHSHDDITLLLIEQDRTKAMQLLELHFESDPKQLRMVRERVQEIAESLKFPKRVVSDLVIALNEACMNVMQHAYKGHHNGEIILEILNNNGNLEMILTDFAEPIDVTSVRSRSLEDIRPGGLGTHFIREIMDTCEYGNLADGKGNYLRMKKRIV